MNFYTQLKTALTLVLVISCLNVICAQDDSNLVNTYKEYIEVPREIVYAHLNKSTYIKGESIGFTAYVLDKKDKKPSLLTTNLYVTITNKADKVVKQKLVNVENGIAENAFEIDSLFTSGVYHFKAYTNWMRNFNEHNYYSESIKIIDPKAEAFVEKAIVENSIDAQFLPESGHLLHGVENSIGVVIKDSQGYGIPNANGEVVDKNNQTLTTFKTNQFGIGKFPLIADSNNHYSIKINHANKDFNIPLGHAVEPTGIILSVKRLKTKLFVSVISNEATLDLIKNKRYTLMVHNGNDYEILDIYFTDNIEVTKIIEYNNIPAGTNILTLINENDVPVAERLFFNYEGIDIVTSNAISTEKTYDSLSIDLGYRNINPQSFNTISISVLPEETVSYNKHHNIVSHTFLQPYVNGPIESASYYFADVDEKKRYELDNLLLTQGWSSYDWNNMFLPKKLPYAFEQGLSLKANINNQKFVNDVYVLHHFGSSQPIYKKASEGNSSFIFENVFPTENDRILISRLESEKEMVPAQLYIQTSPNALPNIKLQYRPIPPKSKYAIAQSLNEVPFYDENTYNLQQLDEIVITSSLDKFRTRTQELSKHKFGNIKIVDQNDRLTFLSLNDFLAFNRVQIEIDPETGDTNYYNGRPNRGPMLVFLNGTPLVNNTILQSYTLSDIDYVEINRGGIGGGVRGLNGILKLYTTTKSTFQDNKVKTSQEVKLPLVFSANKQFYVPKYKSYTNDFYQGFGTVAWQPKLTVNSEGVVSFKVPRPKVPVTLFIEGMTNDGSFIVEEKNISLQ